VATGALNLENLVHIAVIQRSVGPKWALLAEPICHLATDIPLYIVH